MKYDWFIMSIDLAIIKEWLPVILYQISFNLNSNNLYKILRFSYLSDHGTFLKGVNGLLLSLNKDNICSVFAALFSF